jgi:hypothetical protein
VQLPRLEGQIAHLCSNELEVLYMSNILENDEEYPISEVPQPTAARRLGDVEKIHLVLLKFNFEFIE